MKSNGIFLFGVTLFLISCADEESVRPPLQETEPGNYLLRDLAGMLAELPLENGHFREVHDAVSSSSGNGYDEEYLISDLFAAPGKGVGEQQSKAGKTYANPIRDLLSDHVRGKYATRAGGEDGAEEYLKLLSSSDMQIYWPSCDRWDGSSSPVITFDPGYGAESNYGFELVTDSSGKRSVDTVFVDENVARTRPVWVVNRNDDSAFSPAGMFAGTKASSGRPLLLKSFTMLRNYDSWFGGASEFFLKIGAVNGFKATKEEDLKLYAPSVTDFMIVVKRGNLGVDIPYDVMLLSDFTSQMENVAFLISEDDGGTVTNWKCSASVKVQSKAYGFDIDIPYKDKDDIVWRGQLSAEFFQSEDIVSGRFGDVKISFALE